MVLQLRSPSRVYLPEVTEELRQELSFKNTSVSYQLSKAVKRKWLAEKDPEGYLQQIAELKTKLHKSLVLQDEHGEYTYSGLAKSLSSKYGWTIDTSSRRLPIPRPIPWQKMPPKMHYYQEQAVQALMSSIHGDATLPTGSGKSLILLNAARQLGVKTVIVTPFSAITNQLRATFVEYLGKKYVGQYGDGKKESDKLITVAVAQSLAALEPGSEHWENLSKAQVMMFDEAHATPASTFEKVCLGVLGNAWLRFFVTATHTRMDGSDLLLEGITGPVVYQKSFSELVGEGFLSPMKFTFFEVPATESANHPDVDRETRQQLYLNPAVLKHAGEAASKVVQHAGRPTLIILDEFQQFASLRKHITVPFEFVHGGVTKENKQYVPEEFWKCDVEKSVADFNSGKIKLLVGTSAISTGVDTKAAQCIIYLRGGTSEIGVPQSVGRGTRVFPGKKDCWVWDYKIVGSKKMERHADKRAAIYEEFGEVRYVSGTRS